MALAVLGTLGLLLAIGALVWEMLPARDVPSERRLARFIEERTPGLDQRLVSAVDVATARGDEPRPAFAALMVSDAANVVSSINPADIVPTNILRRSGLQAVAAVMLLVAVGVSGRTVGRQWWDALSLAFFPAYTVLEVTPGDARVQEGATLTVEARLVGNSAPVVAQLFRAQGDGDEDWAGAEMASDGRGAFTVSLDGLKSSFRYRVVAGSAESKTYTVAVARAPKATRIDVEYVYPSLFGLAPRTEQDGGDIYAPRGTQVRLRVYADMAAASGRLLLGDDMVVDLKPEGAGTVLTGVLQVESDTFYRVALADAEGLASRGDTEYFIRMMDDRPPEVHVVNPASDRRVTPLEEVDIEVEATDDFGVASLDLVYAIRGGAEAVVPIRVPPNQTSVAGGRTLYLEDLDVRPGDFISYYVRVRDLARGKPSSEARSDIFFLEVRTFEEEFTLAQSQAAMGGGASNPQLDDLVVAQKEIIVATWKLDRRSQAARGAKSEEDIRSVGAAEDRLKTRVEQVSSSFRMSAMRDPRAAPPGPRIQPDGRPPDDVPVVQARPEEEAMTLAAKAMGKAATLLNSLKTSEAMSPEMEALDHLLRAQAGVKKREVPQQQAGGSGTADNRAGQDLSSLFDKELARSQETNYEPQTGGAKPAAPEAAPIDRIKDLAKRQDELVKRQQALARERAAMTETEVKRELETLTREQNDLRQRAEELAQQMAAPQDQAGQQARSQDRQQGQTGQGRGQSGQAAQQDPQGGQSGQPQGQSARERSDNQRMREISDEMRGAANDLRRQDAAQAGARSERALSKLRELERQLQEDSPDGQRQALGDLELEARQLADAQRQIAEESRATAQGQSRQDTMRRLAGQQDRVADRLRSVQGGLKQQAAAGGEAGRVPAGADPASKSAEEARTLRQAAGDASREIERQRLAERMEQSAQAMREQGDGARDATRAPVSASPQTQEDIARALDRVADQLANAGRQQDDESRKVTGQLARAQELRERLDDLDRRLGALAQGGGQQDDQRQPGQGGQRSPTPPQRAAGDPGTGQQGQGRSGGTDASVEALRAEVNREIEQVRRLLDETQAEEGTPGPGGTGRTLEGQGMTLSAPGTEAFKQDFAKWQELRQRATAALESVESTLSRKLQETESKDRLNAGADERAPAGYQQQVDNYFKALASRPNP